MLWILIRSASVLMSTLNIFFVMKKKYKYFLVEKKPHLIWSSVLHLILRHGSTKGGLNSECLCILALTE